VPYSSLTIDHLSIGVQNLHEGAFRLRHKTGFGDYDGGWFPPHGIAVRMMPTGDDTYIEIESNTDFHSKSPSSLWFNEQTVRGDVFIGWSLRVGARQDLEAIAKRLGVDVADSPLRTRPDGSRPHSVRAPESGMAWRRGLPSFFWVENMSQHPSRLPTTGGRLQPLGIKALELGGAEEEMSEWLGMRASELPLTFNGLSAGLHAVSIATEAGIVEIRNPPVTLERQD